MNQTFLKDFEGYCIEAVKEDLIADFMRFMSENHDPSCLLAMSKYFIDEQFYNSERNCYNILAAKKKEDAQILGAIAFVETANYDRTIGDDNFVWITNWLAKKETYPTAGLNLLSSLFQYKQKVNIGTVCYNETAGAIYKAMRFKTGELKHFFQVKEHLRQTVLIQHYEPPNRGRRRLPGNRSYSLCPVDPADFDVLQDRMAVKKTKDYFINKYCNSPFYQYILKVIKRGGTPISLLVLRVDAYQETKAIRIVDFWGDASALRYMNTAFQGLLSDLSAEFLDFYCYGIDEDVMEQAGFSHNTMEGDLMVPCYFEPFRPVNVKINFAYRMRDEGAVTVFKGDGDREFPRIIKEI